MYYKEEGLRIIKDAPLAEGAGVTESAGVKVTNQEVFMEVLRDRQSFLEVDWSIVEKVDKVECRCRLAP